MRPIAYLRRSHVASKKKGKPDQSGRVSFEMQQRQVFDLAARNGDPEPELIVEWGKSGAAAVGDFGGTGRGGKRKVYHDLRERIANGEVSTLYAYSLSRLARSTRELLNLAEACATAGTRIILAKEGSLDFASPHGRLYLTVLAAVSTFEAEVAAERAQDRVAIAKDNGRVLGEPPFGYSLVEGELVGNEEQVAVQAVLRAFDDAGGIYKRAARLLNENGGVATRRGGKWSATSVQAIVNRERGVSTVPRRSGSRSHPTNPLARLLYCANCGGMLTLTVKKYTTKSGDAEHRSWRCYASHDIPGHPKPVNIPDHVIIEQLKDEAARLQPVDAETGEPFDRVRQQVKDAAEMEILRLRRQRLLDAVEAGLYDNDEIRTRLQAIDAAEAAMRQQERVYDVPSIDWNWEPTKLATVLASLWERVKVDFVTQEVGVTWRVPQWRAA
jgi:DNA invertase Pin-like site-specific DNA recombinase